MKFVKLTLIIIFFLLIASPFFFLPKIIKITSVDCVSQYGPCDKGLQNRFTEISGKSLKETNIRIKEIIDENVLIEEYISQYKFPQAIDVNIIVAKPLFALKNVNGDKVVLIDNDGLVLSSIDSSNLPVLIVPFDLPSVGTTVDDNILFALNIIYDMNSSYQVNKGEIIDGYLSANLLSGEEVLFPLKGDREILLGSLSLILSRLNTEEEKIRIEEIQEIKVIDLRFKNPTLK